jgi:hypothetical protein
MPKLTHGETKQAHILFSPLKPEIPHFNSLSKYLGSYLTENAVHLHYIDQLVNTIYSENDMKPINTLPVQYRHFNDKADGIYSSN